jgi:hypothetical protein
MDIRLSRAEPKNKPKYNRSFNANNLIFSFVVHNWKTKISPAETIAASNKYTV